ncbi:hypothetical protein CDO52_17045 [Nocardiopsis gilva YIM 90087]|uniref:Alcohol dehydrogenase iron-type/glycerol dehydrogenase GldA domain-containing protein n=1 Tax=Nocardiopsis gilva YIM 90087 TaxID=1235441 RepID=A0A223S837_9ACTN|nr:iron-containing alcohol dehydrogenase [Nocardiopsis gilva]ASU84273.1 hypothetical protein CDO52_17045 [Nocardiopsis gilva YIM 90087]
MIPGPRLEALDSILACRDPQSALIVTDGFIGDHVRRFDAHLAAVRNRVPRVNMCVIRPDSLATLDSVIEVNGHLRRFSPRIIIAVGGGSVIDAVKLGRAAESEPWLLDRTVWRSHSGHLPFVTSSLRRQRPLIAIPTTPGTASEVSPIAAISVAHGVPRQLVSGESLVPDHVVIDEGFSATLGREFVDASLSEIVFRLLGPYLVTDVSDELTDKAAISVLAELIELGDMRVNGTVLDAGQVRRLYILGMAASKGYLAKGWRPSIHPWWCIQNTLSTVLNVGKGGLTARAFSGVLREMRDCGGALGKLGRWDSLDHFSPPGFQMTEMVLRYFDSARGSKIPLEEINESLISRISEMTFSSWGAVPGIRRLGAGGIAKVLNSAL